MITLAEVRRFVLSSCRPMETIQVPLSGALGLVLAERIEAIEDVPAFANSAMDGYAVRAADTRAAPVRLRVVDHIMAGQRAEVPVGPGEAARIMTGAPIPPGADGVGVIEDALGDPEGSTVVLQRPVRPAANVRYPGEDIARGDDVFVPGTVLGPAHVGVLATLGVETVLVRRQPRVGVLSTGDELVAVSADLGPGKIRDSNRPTLLAQVTTDGFEPADLGSVGDDEPSLALAFERGGSICDAVVTTGGVSVGDRDLVKVVLDKLSRGTTRWVQVAVKPAKPFAFGTLSPSGTPVFGLPGNPVSALIGYELFVRPALRLMAGYPTLDRPRVTATATQDFARRLDGKIHFARATLTTGPGGELLASPSGGSGPHLLRTMATANALAVLPDGPSVTAGQPVDVLLLDADRLNGAPGLHW
jgi:molybdenum cofactor synthesis domain-containing protein